MNDLELRVNILVVEKIGGSSKVAILALQKSVIVFFPKISADTPWCVLENNDDLFNSAATMLGAQRPCA